MEIFLHIFIVICMFVIGSLFGSFFSLATYRLPRHQDIVATRSYCPNCKHRLGFFDLIPVFSYLMRRGQCNYCGDKISLRYFLLETINGLVFVVFYLIFGYTLQLLMVSIIYALLFVVIGSYIMKQQMTSEEIEQVKGMSLAKKKGVFVSEIVIAMILFTILIASSFVLSRNYTNKNLNTVARSNAVTIAVKNMEFAKATNFDQLSTFSNEEKADGITYTINGNVYAYQTAENVNVNQELVKIIEIKVSYMVNGKPYDFSLKTARGRGL